MGRAMLGPWSRHYLYWVRIETQARHGTARRVVLARPIQTLCRVVLRPGQQYRASGQTGRYGPIGHLC